MSFSQTASSTLFIDLATFSELEGFIYGGPNAITWFVASVQKSNWFSFIPISLRHTGTPDFGAKNIAANINRSGDYVLSVWFRALIPRIGLQIKGGGGAGANIRWVRNLMHNLIEKVQITFNELVVEEFDNYWLDNNYYFRIPGSKKIGYRNLIGDVASLTAPVAAGVPLGTGFFSVVLPFWFGEDSGLALPAAALPFNEIKVNYTFRRWQELVMINPGIGGTPYTVSDVRVFDAAGAVVANQEPALGDPQTFAHYAVVHNDERVKMGDAPRDMLIRQVQETNFAPFRDVASQNSFDIRLSHAIVNWFFAAENTSLARQGQSAWGREFSNYTTKSVVCDGVLQNTFGYDPIYFSQLVYESTVRVSMGSDYYSLMVPYLLSDAVPGTPEETGLHMYTYALLPWDPIKPSGSTNYSKLANVSILHNMSQACIDASNTVTPTQDGVAIQIAANPFPQTWRHIFVAQNHNIARVANGSLGHPTL